MKSYRKELFSTCPTAGVLLTSPRKWKSGLRESGIQEGLVLCNSMHITASVYINDDEGGLLHDYEAWLEHLAPHEPTGQYWHNRTGEDNADAHLKRQVMGREVVVAITQGKLDFGPVGADLLRRVRRAPPEAVLVKSSANRKDPARCPAS